MLLQSKNTVLLEERPLLARGHTLRDADRRELPYDTETSIEDEDSVQEGVSAAVIGLISRCPKDRYADAALRARRLHRVSGAETRSFGTCPPIASIKYPPLARACNLS